ncbi:ABC transporter substrate-binding protein [Streptomyces hainanensis]|uniref:ABC transporter substrate-binding protein n=1 Tax=Streptomyces hainanensis TaxID=402648 RepID=UPI0014050608|nr:ABC transporter substrate-binding protein [Streptomyces hainanensis]
MRLRRTDRGQAERAAGAAQRAIDDEDVLAVVGPASFDTVAEAGSLYSAAGLTFVVHSVTEAEADNPEFGTLLCAVPNDERSGTEIGEFLARHPETFRATVIDDREDYGVEVANEVHKVLVARAEGDYFGERDSLEEDVTDIDALAGRIVESGADAVAFLGNSRPAGALAAALASAGFSGVGISGDRAMFPDFVERAGEAAEGWYLASFVVRQNTSPETEDFAARLQEAYDVGADYYAARAYDVTAMIVEAVGGLDGTELNRQTVFDALANGSHRGLTGETRFVNGAYQGSGPHLCQVRDGDFVPLGPIEDYYPTT